MPKHDPFVLLGAFRAASGIVRHLDRWPIRSPIGSGSRHSLIDRRIVIDPAFSVCRFHRKRCTKPINPATTF